MTTATTASEQEGARADSLSELLDRERQTVVGRALCQLGRLHGSHYEGAETERRVGRLYDHVVVAATRRDLGPIVAYAQGLADDRYAGGYSLAEVQAAFNALEEALWKALVHDLPQDQLASALTLISSIFGVAKDALSCSYVTAATRTRTGALNIQSLAAGVASA